MEGKDGPLTSRRGLGFVGLAAVAWWLSAPALAAILYLGGAGLERAVLALALAAALAGAGLSRHRRILAAIAAVLLVASTIALAAHLLGDDFTYHYVWLYSAASLPWYLKLASLWGGEQGTLLFVAALAGLASVRLVRYRGWAGPGALLVTAFFATGALIWDPFVLTPAADLARSESQGMNAHLLRVWMAFHPPLIFASYVLFLAPVGASLQALATGTGEWARIAVRYGRAGWLILSLGLVLGMWWAYEDFTFGQVWHWDPVQTSVFMVWAFSTAHLHCVRRYRPDGAFSLTHPLLGLLTAIAAIASMLVTREPTLASSHRYVGESSLPLLAAGALALGALTAAGLVRRPKGLSSEPMRKSESALLVWIGTGLLTLCALVAAGYIGQAYVSAYLGLPRPDSLKPFFEILARWTSESEVQALEDAFARWDIDNYGMNRWLAPLGIAIGLAGGHMFLPVRGRIRRWLMTGIVAGLAVLSATVFKPFDAFYQGTGMTSKQTVAIFPWLDALAVAVLYLAVAALWAGVHAAIWPRWGRHVYTHFVPVAVIHIGAMLALVAALSATVFDSYGQKMFRYPDDFGKQQRFPDGYAVTVWIDDEAMVADGGRSLDGPGGFRSVARVGWELERAGAVVEARQGHSVYRDARPPVPGGRGPVRLMCEILDYRYARTVSGPRQMIHPFIHRGLWRDVQLWFPVVDYRLGDQASGETELAAAREPTTVPVVLKVYPMMSWLWIGLGLALAGGATATLFAFRKGR